MKEKVCANCMYWSGPFTAACCNGDSEHRGDFVEADDTCGEFTEKDAERTAEGDGG